MSEFRRLGGCREERARVRARTKPLWGAIVLAVGPPSNVKFALKVDRGRSWFMTREKMDG